MVIASGKDGTDERGEGWREDAAAHVAIEIPEDAEVVAAAAEQQQQHHSICRICQLAEGEVDGALPERVTGQLVRLGCGCRGELEVAHQRCAEAWFSIRGGDRCCEICGKNVENIHCGVGAHKFMRQWHDTAAMDGGSSSSASGFSKTQSCCNLLIGCLMIMLILPWLRHGHVL
ncbi:hypothetical protein PR202_ga11548 [Eleusine coracana subsp. coracana]|uniref:RING-CH-type domain-containing protein n=1 Tax=Eleusine coracana subsp. coracana TaxID=191504 RepID=A0AAV5C9T5_ELECO|nr:hypothetical protein PR202_ga11548 [Eleusine coracana subsp. coracana]